MQNQLQGKVLMGKPRKENPPQQTITSNLHDIPKQIMFFSLCVLHVPLDGTWDIIANDIRFLESVLAKPSLFLNICQPLSI